MSDPLLASRHIAPSPHDSSLCLYGCTASQAILLRFCFLEILAKGIFVEILANEDHLADLLLPLCPPFIRGPKGHLLMRV
jgi:hypothetical protein